MVGLASAVVSMTMGATWADAGAGATLAPQGPAAMAFDTARRRVVAFAAGPSGYDSETWEWDGAQWTQVANAGPAARLNPGMVYESNRQRMLLFGGYEEIGNCARAVGDTWEWDGTQWTQVADAGPPPRDNMGMAYDSARSRVVLFGGGYASSGCFEEYLADTWEWDGSQWMQTLEPDAGPGSRSGAAMVFDSAQGLVTLFGGGSRDTWVYDGGSWTQLLVTGPTPTPRSQHAMVYDSSRQTAVMFGGLSNTLVDLGDTWELRGGSWSEVADAGPAPREQHGMAFDSVCNRVVLYGGIDHFNNPFGDTWVYESDGGCSLLSDAGSGDGGSDAGVTPDGGSLDGGSTSSGKAGGCGCEGGWESPIACAGLLALLAGRRRQRK
jgi:hypothetical protein